MITDDFDYSAVYCVGMYLYQLRYRNFELIELLLLHPLRQITFCRLLSRHVCVSTEVSQL
jgi:hypothetical protein